jgi:CheY-like chemotaxis protein
MSGEPILIVDDNPTNLKLARIVLTDEGYDVRTASDAEQALEILETFEPRLVLMDLQLPGMDGLALTAKLKSDPRHRQIVIIALTAYAMKGDADKARAAGCDDYITKPIEIDGLVASVAHWLVTGPRP